MKISMNGEELHMNVGLNLGKEPLALRSMETRVIRPNSQCIIRARVPNVRDGQDILINQMSQKLACIGLGTVPVVDRVKHGRARLIVSNPTSKAITLYKGMKIAEADELVKDEDGQLCELSVPGWNLIDGNHPERDDSVDPEYCINYNKIKLSERDLEKLRRLCEEFARLLKVTVRSGRVPLGNTRSPRPPRFQWPAGLRAHLISTENR